jgi:hypothetical protein
MKIPSSTTIHSCQSCQRFVIDHRQKPISIQIFGSQTPSHFWKPGPRLKDWFDLCADQGQGWINIDFTNDIFLDITIKDIKLAASAGCLFSVYLMEDMPGDDDAFVGFSVVSDSVGHKYYLSTIQISSLGVEEQVLSVPGNSRPFRIFALPGTLNSALHIQDNPHLMFYL